MPGTTEWETWEGHSARRCPGRKAVSAVNVRGDSLHEALISYVSGALSRLLGGRLSHALQHLLTTLSVRNSLREGAFIWAQGFIMAGEGVVECTVHLVVADTYGRSCSHQSTAGTRDQVSPANVHT